MSNAKKTLLALAEFNSWRRGDESLEMPSPAEIGASIDDAVNLLRQYDEMEREMDDRFNAGWNAALAALQEICDDKRGGFRGYSWDSGAGSSGYDEALTQIEDWAGNMR